MRHKKKPKSLTGDTKSFIKSSLKQLNYSRPHGKAYRHIKWVLNTFADLIAECNTIEYEQADRCRRVREMLCLQGMVQVTLHGESYTLPIRIAIHPEYPTKSPFVFINESDQLRFRPKLKHGKYDYLILPKLVNWHPSHCDLKILMTYLIEYLSNVKVYAVLDFGKDVLMYPTLQPALDAAVIPEIPAPSHTQCSAILQSEETTEKTTVSSAINVTSNANPEGEKETAASDSKVEGKEDRELPPPPPPPPPQGDASSLSACLDLASRPRGERPLDSRGERLLDARGERPLDVSGERPLDVSGERLLDVRGDIAGRNNLLLRQYTMHIAEAERAHAVDTAEREADCKPLMADASCQTVESLVHTYVKRETVKKEREFNRSDSSCQTLEEPIYACVKKEVVPEKNNNDVAFDNQNIPAEKFLSATESFRTKPNDAAEEDVNVSISQDDPLAVSSDRGVEVEEGRRVKDMKDVELFDLKNEEIADSVSPDVTCATVHKSPQVDRFYELKELFRKSEEARMAARLAASPTLTFFSPSPTRSNVLLDVNENITAIHDSSSSRRNVAHGARAEMAR